MSVLIGEAIQLVQSLYSKGVQSKDTRLSSRQIYSELTMARSTILRQQANKGQAISKWSIQTIPCVELIKAAPHECPCAPSTGKYILRTKYKIPVAISGLSDSLITSVTTLDGSIRIDETEFTSVKYNDGKKYTSSKAGYYIKNEYLYLVNVTLLTAVSIEGIFDDPLQAQMYPSKCGPCEDCECRAAQDYGFYIDRNALEAVSQIATNRLVILFGQMNQDRFNNANDDSGMGGGKMIHQPQNQPQNQEEE